MRDAGFDAFWPQRVPPNDGGLALGQAVWAAWSDKEKARVLSGSRADTKRDGRDADAGRPR